MGQSGDMEIWVSNNTENKKEEITSLFIYLQEGQDQEKMWPFSSHIVVILMSV